MQSLERCRAQEHPCRQSPAREAGPALPACWQRLVHLPDWKSRAGKPSDPLPVATPAPAVVTAARQQRGQPLPWSPCCSHAGTQSLGRGSSRQGQRGAATPGMAPSALPALTAAPGSRDLIFTARAGLSAPICVCRGRDASAGLAQAGSSVLARRQPPGRQPLRCCRASSAALPAPNPCRSQGWVSPGRRGAPRDPVCLAGGQLSALACTFKAKTLSLQPQNCPLFPIRGATMAPEHLEGGAGGAQCPAELPVPLQTHTCPQQTGTWLMVVRVSLVTPVLSWGHSTVPVAPDSSRSSLGALGLLPSWSPGFCCMERPRLPTSLWLQCSTCFPTACTGAPGCCNLFVPKGLPSAKALGKESSLEGAEGKDRPRGPQQHPGSSHIGPGSWRTEEIGVMKTPRPDGAVSPRERPQELAQPPMPAPRDAAPPRDPLPRLPRAPSSHPRQCWGVQQLQQLLTPDPHSPFQPPTPRPASHPSSPAAALPPHTQSKHWLGFPSSESSSSSRSDSPTGPRSLCRSRSCAQGQLPAVHHRAPREGYRHAGKTKSSARRSNSPN